MEGWSELEYLSGNEAQFITPPEPPLPVGRYQWRAYVYDTRLWSKPSEVRTFIIGIPPRIKVEPSKDYLYADGKSTATITATVTDAEGKAITDETVEMIVDGEGEISPVTNNGDGTYTAIYTAGLVPGAVVITAKAKKWNISDTVEIKLGCTPEIPPTNTLVVTGTVYRETGEVAENGLPVEVNIITQNLTETDVTGETAGDGQYSVTFFDLEKPVAKAGDEILVTVKDDEGKLVGQSRHTLTVVEVEAKETIIDVTPCIPGIIHFTLKLSKGINLVSIPVNLEGWRMSDLANHIGTDDLSMIIRYDYTRHRFISYLPTFPDDSPANALVECGAGYIVVMNAEKEVVFEGNPCEDEIAAPSLMPLMLSSDNQSTSIFVVTGNVRQEGTGNALNEVAVNIRNLRTGQTVEDVTGTLAGYGNYVATFVASSEEFMMRTGDKLEITARDANHRLTIEPVIQTLTSEEISDRVLVMPLRLSLPKQSQPIQPRDVATL